MSALKSAFALVLLALAGCAPAAPPFASVARGIAPLPAGETRLYFYRWLEPYETNAPTQVSLNGQPVGVSEDGAVLYRDVAPGQYTITVKSWGVYPNQFKTVVLQPGETTYVRIESLRSWCNDSGGGDNSGSASGCYDTFVVEIIDPVAARAEMADLRFIRG
jgi:hypothetical protein